MGESTQGGHIQFAPQLDDRLGVYCLLGLLPKMGIQLDILLTTGEEHCQRPRGIFTGITTGWWNSTGRGPTSSSINTRNLAVLADSGRGGELFGYSRS